MGRRDDLEVMRAELLAALTECEPQVKAQIVGQLRHVVKELDELPAQAEQSAVEKARAKRAARRDHLKAV